MKRITMVQTKDGVLHQDERAAKRYLDRRYGDDLLKIGRALANQKYTVVTEWIDANLSAFTALVALKKDMEMDEDE